MKASAGTLVPGPAGVGCAAAPPALEDLPGVIVCDVVFGQPYVRLLLDAVDLDTMARLRNEVAYAFVYVYGPPVPVPGYRVERKHTPVITLPGPRGDVVQQFNSTTRNEIRKSYRIEGLEICGPDDRAEESYSFYETMKRLEGVAPDVRSDFSRCLYFNAYDADRLIASVSSYDSGTVLRWKHLASVRKQAEIDPRLVSYATRRLLAELCQYGNLLGRRQVDLGGIDLHDPAKAGVAQFKQSFRPSIVEVTIYRHESSGFRAVRDRVARENLTLF